MHGLEHEVRAAVNMILELDVIKVGTIRFHRIVVTNFSSGIPPRDSLPN